MTDESAYRAQALKLLDQIDSAVEVPQSQWMPSPYGAYPVVPEFLAGSPDSMRRQMPCESDISPITIWADVNCSASLSQADLLRHGTAILALFMKLQAVRPIQLFVCCALPKRGTRLAVQINGQPLDLATAAFAICHSAFARHLCFGYAGRIDGGWIDRIIDTEREFREFMDIPDTDLAIPGAYGADPLIDNPVAWVNSHIERMRGEP